MYAEKFVIYTQTPKAIGEKIWKNIDDISAMTAKKRIHYRIGVNFAQNLMSDLN